MIFEIQSFKVLQSQHFFFDKKCLKIKPSIILDKELNDSIDF